MKRIPFAYALAVIMSVSTASGPISGFTRQGTFPAYLSPASAGAAPGSAAGPLGYAYDHLD